MTENVCTGHGSSDSHALVLNDGRPNPHPSAGTPYSTISAAQIAAMVSDPPSVAKEAGQWIIPSTYHQHDARSHSAQREHGSYWWMAVDIDQGDPSLQDVSAIVGLALGGDVWLAIYSTRSSRADNKKWRVLIPLAQPLTGEEYGAYQAALFDALEHGGLQMDRTLERTGQLVYLPNRGDFYQWQAEGTHPLDARQHPMATRAQQYMEVYRAGQQAATGAERQEGHRSPLRAFRNKHSIADMLRVYGYVQKGNTDHWRSPYQDSGSYGTQDRGDHWVSLSHSDAAAGLGKATPNGSRYGDAFDLYVHFQCGGNAELGMQYARQCLAEADEARYGDATKEHGWQVWQGLVHIGNSLGPAGHKQAIEESARKAEMLKTPDPSIVDEEYDWDVPWPPGIAGEVAKHIYLSSSRPVKQFAIAMALYILAGMAGQRYNVEGFGLNLYMAIVGNSGTGKGEARRAAKRVYGAFGMEAQDAQGVAEVYDHDFPASSAGLRKMFDGVNNTRAVYREDADALIESLTNTQPGSNGDLLRSALSQFWDQSGEGLNLGAVRYSKEEHSSAMVQSPSLTTGFDLQVDPFKRFLGQSVVLSTGIGARFLYVIRYGKRTRSQKGRGSVLADWVVEAMKNIWQGTRLNHTVTHVGWEPAAHKAFEDMDDAMTDRITAGKDEEDLLNRAHMNAARVAACLAVGTNHQAPVITMEMFRWAQQFVMKGYEECLKLMDAGEVGSGERVRVARAVKAMVEYINMTPTKRSSYRVPKALDGLDDILCERYFLERLRGLADFKGSDLGYSSEDIVRRTIMELVKQEYLIETNRNEIMEMKGVLLHGRINQPLYKLGPAI